MDVSVKLAGLVRDDATGDVSSTKVMNLCAFVAATVAFLRIAWTATAGEGIAWLFLVYMGTTTTNQMASKLLGLRFKNGNGNEAAKS